MPSAQPDVSQSTAVDVITIPRPHVPFGPEGLPAEAADAAYLRRAARDLEKHYKPFGKNLRATVVKLVHDAAEAIIRLTRMQVRDAAHRQAGQIADQCAGGLRDRDRQRADRRGLIHDQQHRAMGLELFEHSA